MVGLHLTLVKNNSLKLSGLEVLEGEKTTFYFPQYFSRCLKFFHRPPNFEVGSTQRNSSYIVHTVRKNKKNQFVFVWNFTKSTKNQKCPNFSIKRFWRSQKIVHIIISSWSITTKNRWKIIPTRFWGSPSWVQRFII